MKNDDNHTMGIDRHGHCI